MPVDGIGQIAIVVKDLDRAVTFYRDRLGITMLFAVPNMAFFECGGVRLMLGPASAPEFEHPSSILYYKVADIGAEYRRMLAAGVEFRDEPHSVAKLPGHELWMTFCKDTEGNTLALMSEVRE